MRMMRMMDGHAFGRSHRRYQISFPVVCQSALQEVPVPPMVSGRTRNLGEGGACLVLAEPVRPNTLLRFSLETEEAHLPLEARVVWVAQPSPEGTEHGVAFSHLTPDQRQGLRAALTSRERSYQPQPAGLSTTFSVQRAPGPPPPRSFRVIFEGELKAGVQAGEVKPRLAHLFQVDESRLALLTRGREVRLIKQGLDRATAGRLVAACGEAGAVCRMEADPPPDVPEAVIERIANAWLRAERHPGSLARSRAVLRYTVGGAIALLLLLLGILWSNGTLRMNGWGRILPASMRSQIEKLLPSTARETSKTSNARPPASARTSPAR